MNFLSCSERTVWAVLVTKLSIIFTIMVTSGVMVAVADRGAGAGLRNQTPTSYGGGVVTGSVGRSKGSFLVVPQSGVGKRNSGPTVILPNNQKWRGGANNGPTVIDTNSKRGVNTSSGTMGYGGQGGQSFGSFIGAVSRLPIVNYNRHLAEVAIGGDARRRLVVEIASTELPGSTWSSDRYQTSVDSNIDVIEGQQEQPAASAEATSDSKQASPTDAPPSTIELSTIELSMGPSAQIPIEAETIVEAADGGEEEEHLRVASPSTDDDDAGSKSSNSKSSESSNSD